jgi:pyrroloquinoline-quinone synthase
MTPPELEAQLRDIGARRYHRLHPFHGLLHGEGCGSTRLDRYLHRAVRDNRILSGMAILAPAAWRNSSA